MSITFKGKFDGRAEVRGLLLLAATIFTSAALTLAQSPAELTPSNAERLRRQIESGSAEEKRTALFDIRNLRSSAASAIALPALRDANVMVRSTAASSVVFLPKQEAASALLPLLNDRDEFVRREAAYALGEVADRSATSGLVSLMEKDKVFEVRTAAALALGKVGDPTAIESLLRVLRRKPAEEQELLRRNAARSIGQIAQINWSGNPTVVTPENFLPDKFKDFGPVAGGPAVGTAAVDTLIAVLSSKAESDDTRREAAFALGAIGDARALPALQRAAASEDPYLVDIAREAVIKIERRNRPADSEK